MGKTFLVLGAKGQLGRDFCEALQAQGLPFLGLDRPEVDITDPVSIETRTSSWVSSSLKEGHSLVVLNCAAYTDVEKAETERDLCRAVNVIGAGHVARWARRWNGSVVYFSTDFVFDGQKGAPYVETDPPRPLSYYGLSKWEGEEETRRCCPQHFLLRLAWLYGEHGNHFIGKIAEQAQKNPERRVVDDQWGSPTWTVDVVRQTLALVNTDHHGLFHAVNTGGVSRRDLAARALDLLGIPCRVIGCKSDEFPQKAVRPPSSELKNEGLDRLGLNLMPPWPDALARFCDVYKRRFL